MKKCLIAIISFSIGFSMIFWLFTPTSIVKIEDNPDAYYEDNGYDCIDTVDCKCDYCSYNF